MLLFILPGFKQYSIKINLNFLNLEHINQSVSVFYLLLICGTCFKVFAIFINTELLAGSNKHYIALLFEICNKGDL